MEKGLPRRHDEPFPRPKFDDFVRKPFGVRGTILEKSLGAMAKANVHARPDLN
jgi:hypothetical protein